MRRLIKTKRASRKLSPVDVLCLLFISLTSLPSCNKEVPEWYEGESGLLGRCSEGLEQYLDCGLDTDSPGRPTLQKHVDGLLAGECSEVLGCFADCLVYTHAEDECWSCEFTDADCFGDDKVLNPLMDCAEACPDW